MLKFPSHKVRSLTTGFVLKNATAAAGLQHQNGSSMPKNIKPVIGLEVHAQLNIRSKLFSRGSNKKEASPNSQLDFLDVSIPGSLPKLNHLAVKAAMITSLGLNCTVQDRIYFDRKNYFYTDMPAGYQITQYNQPIALDGFIDFIVTDYQQSFLTHFAHSQHYDLVKYLYYDEWKSKHEFQPYIKRSQIQQLQLEQDSAKTLYQTLNDKEELNNLVDYNRSGAGLIEIVFKPDLTRPDEASSLVRHLIMILKSLKTCDCELQEGSLRVDANVSIGSIDGREIPSIVSNRVELKNLNSLRSLHRGISYEIQRQAVQILSGEKVIQESRAFDTKTGRTNVLRTKESAVDYRYVPEPSIPPLRIPRALVEQTKRELEENVVLPDQIRRLLQDKYNLELSLIVELINEPGLARYYLAIMSNENSSFDPNSVADFLIYSVANLKSIQNLPIKVDLEDEKSDFMMKLSPNKMKKLLKMAFNEEISFSIAYETMKCLFTSNAECCPHQLVEKLGWFQLNDENQIDAYCAEVIKNMKSISKRYRKRGEKKDLRYMLDKLNELHNNRINVRKAMNCINRRLRPEQDTSEESNSRD